ncbi:hypothetical protein [Rhodovarius sp.]|uniref:hypothetical protein n=1 Tax=Rhodovarius sp. TaxID=2972673 RepID=UPI0034A4764F
MAKATDTNAEETSTAKASDELSEDDLEAVAGGMTAYERALSLVKNQSAINHYNFIMRGISGSSKP